MLAMVVEEQCFGATFAFVVASTGADWVDVSLIVFRLSMHARVAVDFAGRRLQHTDLQALGKTENIDRAMHVRFRRFNRVALVVNGRGKESQVIDFVHLDIERKGHIVADQFEIRITEQMRDVNLRAGIVIVDANHFMTALDQSLA